MTDSIKVREAGSGLDYDVKTDRINGKDYPIYKLSVGGDGEAALVDGDNRLSVSSDDTTAQLHANAVQRDLLNGILLELKILNKYMSLAQDEKFTEDDLEER